MLKRPRSHKAILIATQTLIVGLVFHAVFITVWENQIGHFNLVARAWKEILLAVLLVASVPQIVKQKIWEERIFQLLAGYCLLHFIYAIGFWNGVASLAGLRFNLTMFACFFVGRVYYSSLELKKLEKIIIILGGLVVASVFLQVFMPELFDYNLVNQNETVKTIQDSQIRRLHGLLPGPLQLGSYLVLVFSIGLHRLRQAKNKKIWIFYLATVVFAAFLSYSRASLLGIISVAAVTTLPEINQRLNSTQKRLIIGSMIFVGLAVFFLALTWRPLSLVVFHAEPQHALTKSSTADHFLYALAGAELLIKNPAGLGPGAAGVASFIVGDAVINPENYYLQIGLEVGVFGLLLFSFLILKTGRLIRDNAVLFPSLVAFSIMSLFLFTWTDTATAWTFWLLAGIVIGQRIGSKAPNEPSR